MTFRFQIARDRNHTHTVDILVVIGSKLDSRDFKLDILFLKKNQIYIPLKKLKYIYLFILPKLKEKTQIYLP